MKLGILGGGQLAQMLMLSAYPLGIKTSAIESTRFAPASLVGHLVVADVSDTEHLHQWASQCDLITYESENFPAALIADLAEVRPVWPDTRALATMQDRGEEKRFFSELKIPVAPFRLIDTAVDIERAISELLAPLIFKTRTGGYDGKGQITYNEGAPLEPIIKLLAAGPLIAEEKVELTSEISVIGVRSADGSIEIYPVTENEHRNGILHKSVVPAAISAVMTADAREYITMILQKLEYVGVLALEMFVTGDKLMANEMAPRVHNSGHWTIEGAETSQFENHVRAITGLPLGDTGLREPTTMINLVGAIPSQKPLLRITGTHLHVYGKEARPGRKLGHVTVTAADPAQLRQRVAAVETVVHNVLS